MRRYLLRQSALCLMALMCLAGFVDAQDVSMIQEKRLYGTDFEDWSTASAAARETTYAKKTKYTSEDFTIALFNTEVRSVTDTKFEAYTDLPKMALMAAKSADPYVKTSVLSQVSSVRFVHGATGGSRGWKLEAKGDGDTDWVVVSESFSNPAAWCEVKAEVNKTNCELRFTNLNASQNAYMFELEIYGNVDMSKYPMLGSFVANGVTYQAAEICEDASDGSLVATIEVPKAQQMISETNPLSDVVTENGEITKTTYETTGEGTTQKTVVTIEVTANGVQAVYRFTFVFKPDFTLTYYNTDGTVLGTQSVEKDAAIGTFAKTEEDVTVADSKKFRGWFVDADGGRKYTTGEVVLSDLGLYAVATDIEVPSTTARYSYNLIDKYFYAEDHEAFNPTGAAFNSSTHGWKLDANGRIDLLVGGHAYIVMELCTSTDKTSVLTLSGPGNFVETRDACGTSDGRLMAIEYEGAAGTLTLTADKGMHLHKLRIVNVEENPIEKNAQGYYAVKAGDADNLLNVLDIANSAASDTERTFIFVPDGLYDLGSAVLTPICGNNISIIGQSMDNTIIMNTPKEEGIGVTATFYVTAQNTYMQDLTLKNAYDYYKPGFAGRAVCLQDKGKRTICKNVRMLSYQDTYYSNAHEQFYFETSDIHGTVDFICGSGDVFFNQCTLTVEQRNADGTGGCTITAPATLVADNTITRFGYVFSGCTIDNKAAEYNFGRAWNDNPCCAYINTTLLDPNRLAKNRWTTGGMGTAANRFVEYNTTDANGSVVSPASHILEFTHSSGNKKYETILTDEEAAGYAIDKVFPDWTPAEYAAQKTIAEVRDAGGSIEWSAVDGAKAYTVFYKGTFLTVTDATTFAITEGTADDYTVRAANGMGGFGPVAGTGVVGIETVCAANADVVSMEYYTVDGMRVQAPVRGLNICVKTLDNGQKVSEKVMVK